MIAASILILSVAALGQFYMAYCRSLLAAYSKVELSAHVREVAKIQSELADPAEFHRLMVLVRVAPDPGDDAMEIRAIGTYHGLVRLAGKLTARLPGRIANWIDQELKTCTYFAAVTLDRRLASSRSS